MCFCCLSVCLLLVFIVVLCLCEQVVDPARRTQFTPQWRTCTGNLLWFVRFVHCLFSVVSAFCDCVYKRVFLLFHVCVNRYDTKYDVVPSRCNTRTIQERVFDGEITFVEPKSVFLHCVLCFDVVCAVVLCVYCCC